MEILCTRCKQLLYSIETDQGIEVYPCNLCLQKSTTQMYRTFIQEIPASLLAAARTLETSDASQAE